MTTGGSAPAPGTPGATGPAANSERTLNAVSAEKTQEAAKWLIAALAASAGVIFGVGPIVSQPDLDPDKHLGQLIVAGAGGSVGAIGIAWLIAQIARVLAPPRITMANLPAGLEEEINKNGAWILPTDVTTVAALGAKLRQWKEFTSATQADADKARRQAKLAEARGDKQAAASADAEAQLYAEDYRDGAATVRLYQERADRILDEARFEAVREQLHYGRITFAAILAALGALTFTLALAQDPKNTAKAAAVPSPAKIGYIPAPPADSRVQRTLWANLNLNECAIQDGTVPVIVQGGGGTADDPWVVTTFSTNSAGPCRSQTFNLHEDVVRLRIPDPAHTVIVYDSGLDQAGKPTSASPDPANTPTPTSPGATPAGTSAPAKST